MDADETKSKRGGKRDGAGRPPTRRTVATTALDVVVRWRADGKREPLQVMLDAMDRVLAENGPIAAFPFAQACAPFMHARLGTIEHSAVVAHVGADGGPVAVRVSADVYRAIAEEVASKT